MRTAQSTRGLADVPITTQQHRYYRGVIVPAIARHCGYESLDDAHRAIKAAFYDIHPDSPHMPSMADMSKEETIRYFDYALREAAEMSLIVPDPERRR